MSVQRETQKTHQLDLQASELRPPPDVGVVGADPRRRGLPPDGLPVRGLQVLEVVHLRLRGGQIGVCCLRLLLMRISKRSNCLQLVLPIVALMLVVAAVVFRSTYLRREGLNIVCNYVYNGR